MSIDCYGSQFRDYNLPRQAYGMILVFCKFLCIPIWICMEAVLPENETAVDLQPSLLTSAF